MDQNHLIVKMLITCHLQSFEVFFFFFKETNTVILGRQDGLEICTAVSKLSSLGLIPDSAINSQSQCFTGRVIHQRVCVVPQTLNWMSSLPEFVGGH